MRDVLRIGHPRMRVAPTPPAAYACASNSTLKHLEKSMRQSMQVKLAALAALLVPMLAQAVQVAAPAHVPEPGTWSLLALAGVVGAVVSRRRK